MTSNTFQKRSSQQGDVVPFKAIKWIDHFEDPRQVMDRENVDHRFDGHRTTQIINEQYHAVDDNIAFYQYMIDRSMSDKSDRDYATDQLRLNWDRRWNLYILSSQYTNGQFDEMRLRTGYHIARCRVSLQKIPIFVLILCTVLMCCLMFNVHSPFSYSADLQSNTDQVGRVPFDPMTDGLAANMVEMELVDATNIDSNTIRTTKGSLSKEAQRRLSEDAVPETETGTLEEGEVAPEDPAEDANPEDPAAEEADTTEGDAAAEETDDVPAEDVAATDDTTGDDAPAADAEAGSEADVPAAEEDETTAVTTEEDEKPTPPNGALTTKGIMNALLQPPHYVRPEHKDYSIHYKVSVETSNPATSFRFLFEQESSFHPRFFTAHSPDPKEIIETTQMVFGSVLMLEGITPDTPQPISDDEDEKAVRGNIEFIAKVRDGDEHKEVSLFELKFKPAFDEKKGVNLVLNAEVNEIEEFVTNGDEEQCPGGPDCDIRLSVYRWFTDKGKDTEIVLLDGSDHKEHCVLKCGEDDKESHKEGEEEKAESAEKETKEPEGVTVSVEGTGVDKTEHVLQSGASVTLTVGPVTGELGVNVEQGAVGGAEATETTEEGAAGLETEEAEALPAE